SFSIEKSMEFFLSVRLVAGSQKGNDLASKYFLRPSNTLHSGGYLCRLLKKKLTLNFIGRLERPKPGRSTKLDTLTEWIE
ncbi:14106_t:CDS:2, partial [Funneliformis mosseae]